MMRIRVFVNLLLLLALLGCASHLDEVDLVDVSGQSRSIGKVGDMPQVMSLVHSEIGLRSADKSFAVNQPSATIGLNLIEDRILELKEEGGKSTYTFGIVDDDNDPAVFYNLVLKIDNGVLIQRPMLLKYEMTDSFLQEYLTDGDMEGFQGTISRYFINNAGSSGSLRGTANLEGATQLDLSPCSTKQNVGDTGSSGGGGGSGGSQGPSGQDFGDWQCHTTTTVHKWYSKVCDANGQNCGESTLVSLTTSTITTCEPVNNADSEEPSGCTPEEEEIPIIDPTFDDQIDDELLKECMKKVLEDLKLVEAGAGEFIQLFSGETPGFNWVLKSGFIAGSTVARTARCDKASQTVTTVFDRNSFSKASELKIAQTMLHESIHAYLTAYFGLDPASATLTYVDMYEKWLLIKDETAVHHWEMTQSFIDGIALALKSFGALRGYTNLSDQFYKDLAWSGLDGTEAFQSLSAQTRKRIKDTIQIELNGTDADGNSKTPKGNDGGC